MTIKIEHDLLIVDDQYVNDLTMDWYFLTLHFNSSAGIQADQITNEPIEIGSQLKRYLNYGGHTFLEPMNVCVDTETFFNIWLDADGDIQTSELYTDAD